ncbi:MAG TPA: hypothetical protein VL860_06665, partial [Planctomycetota bacterium]|nr:hypothetical protein [Planctomycetota bacterium]
MKEQFSARLIRVSKGFLRSRVGSRTSSLAYVTIVSLLCLALGLCGYLRRDGAKVQFARFTTNTGLSYGKNEWTPTSLVIKDLKFNPRRDDPAHHYAPGKLFDSLDSAEVDSIQIQWGWSFLPTPTAIAFSGARPVVTTGKLQGTLDWLRQLPAG